MHGLPDRSGHMGEDGDNGAPALLAKVEAAQVRDRRLNGNAMLSSKLLRAGEANCRLVDRCDLKAERCEIDRVAALAFGKTEHRTLQP